jgi:CBS domain-containing protein
MKIVRDILDKKGAEVWTIEPSATVREALTEMAVKNVGALVVTDNKRVVGVISERDYARKVIMKGKSSLDTRVAEIMATDPICVTPSLTIGECMSRMTDKRVRHLPVLDADDTLVGLVSIGDVVAGVLSECESKVDELQSFVYGT